MKIGESKSWLISLTYSEIEKQCKETDKNQSVPFTKIEELTKSKKEGKGTVDSGGEILVV